VVAILDAHAASVHQLEVPITGLDERGETITGHPRRGINDGDLAAGQPVEERRLANVGTTDNGNHRNGHGPNLRCVLPRPMPGGGKLVFVIVPRMATVAYQCGFAGSRRRPRPTVACGSPRNEWGPSCLRARRVGGGADALAEYHQVVAVGVIIADARF